MTTRRDFLRYSACLALSACSPKYIAKVSEMFQSKPYLIEEKLRSSRLSVNRSRNLRRYRALPNDPYTRELELIILARSAKHEESFIYAEPELVWDEIGIQFANDSSVNDGHDHKTEAKYSSRLLGSVDLLFSGKNRRIPKPSKVTNYHFHPVFLRAYNVYNLGHRRMRSSTSFSSLEEWAYHACLVPSPPSMGDYITDEVFKARFGRQNIVSVSRVADHSHIWQFELNRSFMDWLKSDKLTFTEYQDMWKKFEKTFVSVDRDMFFGKCSKTASGYVDELNKRLSHLKFPAACLNLTYRQVHRRFKPSQNEFLSLLRSWGFIS